MSMPITPQRVAVGSQNPTKVASVTHVVRRLWPDVEVVAVEVPSGVGVQPASDEEAICGARNRAQQALASAGADLGVGLEGSVIDTAHGMFLEGWTVVVDRQGREGIASGGRILLPRQIAAAVRAGAEVGPVSSCLTGIPRIKERQGTVGYLTNGLVTRVTAQEKTVAYALARFLHPELYEEERICREPDR